MRCSSFIKGVCFPFCVLSIFLTACTPAGDASRNTSSSSTASAVSSISSADVTQTSFDCAQIPVPESPSLVQRQDVGDFMIDIPYNPAWLDNEGEQLLSGEKTSAGFTFGPYRYTPDFNRVDLRHWKNTLCSPTRDFNYVLSPGTREEILSQEQAQVPVSAKDTITIQHIGSVDAVVVPAPEGVCPTPRIIVLGTTGQNYDFSLSCQATAFFKDPLQQLKDVVQSIVLTK